MKTFSLLMRKTVNWRTTLGVGSLWFAMAATANAQMTNVNAPVCPGGCRPAGIYGFCRTNWHTWPGAVYPGMMSPTQAGEEISPNSTDVPTQSKEAQIQQPPQQQAPSRDSGKSSGPGPIPGGATPDTSGLPSPTIAPFPETPMPQHETPGGTSPDPLFGPPGSSTFPPSSTGPATPGTSEPSGSRSSTTPNFRARPTVAESNSGTTNARDSQGRWSPADSKDAQGWKSPRFRSGNSSFVRATTPDEEPGLIVPSLAAQSLDTSSQDVRAARGMYVNPLRSDSLAFANSAVRTSAVQPAANFDSARPAADNDHSVDSTSSTPIRANPLRRD
jgi:hypothetical protein